MSFIKNFTEKLLEAEYRPIANFYDNRNIGENTEHLGLIKQVGGIAYGVVIINADRKYDYMGFYKDVISFFSQLKKVVVTGIFVSKTPDEDLIKFTDNDVEDFEESLIDIRWIVDITENKIIVNGKQPNKIMDIEKLIKESFHDGSYTVAQDLRVLQKKNIEKRNSEIKSSNIWITLSLIIINGIILVIDLCGNYFGYDTVSEYGAVSKNAVLSGEWYRLITYMFIHGGISHYLGNSLSLYILGSRVEKYYGKVNMLIIYFTAGIGAGVMSMLFNNVPAVGASGAIFGLMAGILVYTKIKNRSVDGFDNYFVIIFAIMGIFSGFLIAGVDNWGHIGGFASGIIASIILLKENKNE